MYEKTIWKDELTNENNEIIQEGTPLNASNFNKIEQQIQKNSNSVDNLEVNVDITSKEINTMKEAILENRPIVITDDVPIGTILWYSSKKINELNIDMWKICNGQELNKVDYLELWNAIGDHSNYGNLGTDTFKIPDLMSSNRFIRSIGTDYNVGHLEDDSFKSHGHNLVNNSNKKIVHSTKHSNSGVHDNSFDTYLYDDSRTNHRPTIEPWQFASYTGSSGSSETKPKNIALIPIIKCKQLSPHINDVAREWTDFKETGGIIGGADGPEIFDVGIRRNGPLFFRKGSNKGVCVNDKELSPEIVNDFSLGNPGFTFKDIWLGVYSKYKTGYTKLPNGFILQWGETTLTFSNTSISKANVNYPIAFSSESIASGTSILGGKFRFSDNLITNRAFATRIEFEAQNISSQVTGDIQIKWWSIGY